jgi:erythromycin esterase
MLRIKPPQICGFCLCVVLCVGPAFALDGNAWEQTKTDSGLTSPKNEAGKIAWLKDHGVRIRTVDIKDNDFSDLMPLVGKIGPARVVMLGEQSHGDGTVFLLKGRLIRFLHEVMGFDVLAWESGLYDCREMNAALVSSMPLENAIARGIFGIWGRSEQVYPLFEYARSTTTTTRPLEMAGFDCQLSSPSAWESLPLRMIEFIDRADSKFLGQEEKDKILQIAPDKNFLARPSQERALRLAFYRSLPELFSRAEPKLDKFYSEREIAFWKRVFGNLPIFFEINDKLAAAGEKKQSIQPSEIKARDISMGENLTWLAKEYFAGRKIMVWAASSHNLRDPESIKVSLPGMENGYKGYVTEGQTAYSHLGEAIYSIAFTAYQGKIGYANRKAPSTDIGPAPAGSMPDLIHKTGEKFLFLDFKEFATDPSHWLHQPIVDRPLGHAAMETDWTKQFDALIFTDILEPSTTKAAIESEQKK